MTDPAEMEAIWKAYKGNGGTLSHKGIERQFRLKPAHGMTALRVMKRFEEERTKPDASSTGKPKAE